MYTKDSKILSVLLTISCLAPLSVLANEQAMTISAGGAVGGGGTAATLLVEYEHAITDHFALAGRGGYMTYSYSDSEYEEAGNGPGVQMSAKFYPASTALHGFYVGGGLGVWQMSGDWTDDKGTSYQSTGDLSTTNAEIHGEVGWRIGKKVQFSPSLQVGTFLSSDAVLAEFFSINFGVSFLF